MFDLNLVWKLLQVLTQNSVNNWSFNLVFCGKSANRSLWSYNINVTCWSTSLFSTTSRQIMHSSCVQKCIHQLQNGYSSWCAFHFEMFSELLLSKLNWICFSVEPYNLYSLIYAVNHLEWRLLLCNVVYYAYLCCEWPSLVLNNINVAR